MESFPGWSGDCKELSLGDEQMEESPSDLLQPPALCLKGASTVWSIRFCLYSWELGRGIIGSQSASLQYTGTFYSDVMHFSWWSVIGFGIVVICPRLWFQFTIFCVVDSGVFYQLSHHMHMYICTESGGSVHVRIKVPCIKLSHVLFMQTHKSCPPLSTTMYIHIHVVSGPLTFALPH
jgi:hypothetical protein